MSGAETVAGLALAVLPIIISAAEHYENCLRPFTRYKNFGREADRFRKLLRNQKTIFRSQCLILLKEIVEDDVASSFLNRAERRSLSVSRVEEQLVQLLGESREACVATIEMIEERLCEIEGESQELGHIIDHDRQISTDPVDVKAWKHRITKKLRFSLSGSRLDKILCDLRSLNDDFRTLSDQRLKSTSTQKRRLAGNLYNHSHQEVEKYKAVGHASRQVYEALGKACTKHTEHEAHFCVEVEQVIIDESHGTQLRFNMAFTHLTLAGSINKGPLIWFVVDSKSSDAMALEHPVVTAEYNGLLAHSLKRQIEPIEPTPGAPQKKVKKSVRFETSALAPTCTSTSATATMDDALLACKSMREDFCDSIRKRIRHPSKESQCVSIIGDIDSYRHHVFLSSTTSCYQRRQAISLGHLISRMSNGQNMNRISLYDRLRLAKTLAIAVLQYHATPWLTVSWRSGDVYFFGDDMNPIQERISLTPPHLSVKIKRPNGKMSRGSTLPNNTFIRNPLLFSLGVVLLEIAHTSTLGNLQRPSDLENGQESKYTEFFVARRLAKFGSTDMGRRYHRIVERLVECDFGCGTDLNSPQLQAAFHEDIICPLEKLEQKLHDFHFDPDLAPKESPLSDQEASRT